MNQSFKLNLFKYLPFIIILLSAMFWLTENPERLIRSGLPYKFNRLGQLFGIIGYSFFALSLLLSTRIRLFEKMLGGLDRVYHLHHRLGTIGFISIIIHPLILSLKWLPQNPMRTAAYLLPWHNKLSVNLGALAFWAFLVILGLTYLKWLPYDKWKILHKFLAAVFVLAAFHVYTGDTPRSVLLQSYLGIATAIGVLSAVYRTVLFYLIHKPLQFQVQNIVRRTNRVIEITLSLEPLAKFQQKAFWLFHRSLPRVTNPLLLGVCEFVAHGKFRQNSSKNRFRWNFASGSPETDFPYEAGQFLFVSFRSPLLTTEQHPFTISTPPESGKISVTVKALGDYTVNLIDNLKTGDTALIEGPYGSFNYRMGGNRQIWIAGGIGIAPFLCWAREIAAQERPFNAIDLYYCVPLAEECAFLNELKNLQSQIPDFHVREIYTRTVGHITAEKIDKELGELIQADIFLCGPKRMTADLKRQFLEFGIPENRIHYEDFEFI